MNRRAAIYRAISGMSALGSGVADATSSRTPRVRSPGLVSIRDFSALGDGRTDDTRAIQAAIDFLGTSGGTLYVPCGRYLVSDHDKDGACLVVRNPIQIIGDGPFYSAIVPSGNIDPSVDILVFNPSQRAAADFSSVERIMIGDGRSERRTGRSGIVCITREPRQYLPKFSVHRVFIAEGSGWGIQHVNNRKNNPNGGMYCACIDDSAIRGGIQLDGSGDSIVIARNIIAGRNVGIYVSLVAGASLLTIQDNNVTSMGGAFRIDCGPRTSILRNNCEHSTLGASTKAVIDINSVAGEFVAGVIAQNLFSAFGSSDAQTLLRIRKGVGTEISGNTFLAGTAGMTAVEIDDSRGVRVGPNLYNDAIGTRVKDAGLGSVGVTKIVTPHPKWEIAGGEYGLPAFFKSEDGMVFLSGALGSSTASPGSIIFSLPTGFRPAESERFLCPSVGPVSPGVSSIRVMRGGDVIYEGGGANELSLSGIRFRVDQSEELKSRE